MDSGFKNPLEMFSDLNADLEEKFNAAKPSKPRFADPGELFGGLQKDLGSKIRKTKESAWKDPSANVRSNMKDGESRRRETRSSKRNDPESIFGAVEGTCYFGMEAKGCF